MLPPSHHTNTIPQSFAATAPPTSRDRSALGNQRSRRAFPAWAPSTHARWPGSGAPDTQRSSLPHRISLANCIVPAQRRPAAQLSPSRLLPAQQRKDRRFGRGCPTRDAPRRAPARIAALHTTSLRHPVLLLPAAAVDAAVEKEAAPVRRNCRFLVRCSTVEDRRVARCTADLAWSSTLPVSSRHRFSLCSCFRSSSTAIASPRCGP